MRILTMGLLAATIALIAAPAQAVFIGNGTVAFVGPTNPSVTVASPTSTFNPGPGSVAFGGTNNALITSANGSMAASVGQQGLFAGNINFSTLVGSTLLQTVSNFFTFGSGTGSQYKFSVNSVRTDTYDTSTNGNVSFVLYLLGTTIDTGARANNVDPTPTSLTLTFASTGGSPYSSSGSLAIPPSGTVPEPASWALMLAGFGLMGYSMRSARRKVAVNFG